MRFFGVIIILGLLSNHAFAVQVKGLYAAIEPVQTQAVKERRAAVRKAINRVVQKVTGRVEVLNNAALQSALSNVDSYIEQFQYLKADGDAEGFKLRVKFQKAAIDGTLQQYGFPIWGANRPAIMVWLAVESGSKRYLVGEATSKTAALLQKVANQSGVPIILPLLDLQDQRALDFNDVWGLFSERIVQASARYGAQQVLFARLLKEQGNSWKISWSFVGNKGRFEGESRQIRLSDALAASLNASAEQLANNYAPRGNSIESHVVLHVSGIKGLADFSRVSRYLAALDVVTKVSWQHVNATEASFVINMSGGVNGLKELIMLNRVLENVNDIQRILPVPVAENNLQAENAQFPLTAPQQTLYYRVR